MARTDPDYAPNSMAQLKVERGRSFGSDSNSSVVSHCEEQAWVPGLAADSGDAIAVTAARKEALGASTPR